MSPANPVLETLVPLAVARHFLEALHDGRMIDALDAFAPDAVIEENPGHEHRGVRAIAVTLLPYRRPGLVDVIELRPSADGATARLRTTTAIGGRGRVYRASFRISGRRIRSLRLSPA